MNCIRDGEITDQHAGVNVIGKVIKQRYRVYDEIGQGSVAAVYPLTRGGP
jgi:hypothetical protein